MTTAEKIVDIAKSQIGVKESPPNSNNVLYNTAYYGHPVSGKDYAWCVVFVWWVFRKAGESDLFYGGRKTASCTTLMNWAKNNGLWVTSGYKPGDVVIFNLDSDKAPEHCGIVERGLGSDVWDIEGNTSGYGSQSDGGEVCRKLRSKRLIIGAFRPSLAKHEKGGFDLSRLEELRKGAKGGTVRAMQILLNGYGYKCGEADGIFGEKTLSALKSYQKAVGLKADGICGEKTWKKLLGG